MVCVTVIPGRHCMEYTFPVLSLILIGAISASAQTTTTNTNCNVYGNQVNCTSTSTDDSAAKAAQAELQRENDEAMRQTGNALGTAIGTAITARTQRHREIQTAHRYSSWSDGVNDTLARHPEISDNPANRIALLMYVQDNHLPALKRKSWDNAYKALKSEGKLESHP